LNAFNKCAYVYEVNYDGQPEVHYNINKTKKEENSAEIIIRYSQSVHVYS